MISREAALARLAAADWLVAAKSFFDCLGGAEGRTRAVGGIVRDTLLGRLRSSTDIDMATELLPAQVAERAGAAGLGVHPTGIDHGTITLVHRGLAAEVTTLRRDVETFGRHATVAFGTDWAEDARRRDFTMNALYCGPDGALFDPLGGLDDCLAGRVRFIGDPDARIREDRLRVYRYFRFAASHGDQRFEQDALDACARSAPDLAMLSSERVGSEMMRLLGQNRCAKSLVVMLDLRVLSPALFSDDIIEAAERLEALVDEGDPEIRLAAMVLQGLNLDSLRSAWRLSNATMKAVLSLSEGARLAQEEKWGELGYRFPELRLKAVAVAAAAFERSLEWLAQAQQAVASIEPSAFPISGGDLIALGFEPGPRLGAELKRLEASWIQSGFTLTREALLAEARA